MRNLLICFILSSLLLSSFENVKINFDPNNLRLTCKPEKIKIFLEALLKTENFQLLARILKTEASDFVIPYCNVWKSADNFKLFHEIWTGKYTGHVSHEILRFFGKLYCRNVFQNLIMQLYNYQHK